MRFVSTVMAITAIGVMLAGCDDTKEKTNKAPPKDLAEIVVATVETMPMADADDAADDPAIWINPADPAASVIIGTNKKRGLAVYALDGKELSFRADGRMNNVDIRQNVLLGGQTFDVVVASNRTTNTIDVYKFDAGTRTLLPLMPPVVTNFPEPYGICLYRSVKTGALHIFLNDTNSTMGEWRLTSDDGATFKAEQLRTFAVGKTGSQAEGCAADDSNGILFVAEEDVGLYAYDIENPGKERVVIDTVANGHLTDDVEGVAIAQEGDGGYVIASSQGSNSYNVYDRKAPYAFLGVFMIRDGVASNGSPIDAVEDTDGIDVTTAALGPAFPGGVFVAQDGVNFEGPEKKRIPQNFKLVPWPAIRDALKLPAPATAPAPTE